MEQQRPEEPHDFNTDDQAEQALLEALEGMARSDAKMRLRLQQQRELEYLQ